MSSYALNYRNEGNTQWHVLYENILNIAEELFQNQVNAGYDHVELYRLEFKDNHLINRFNSIAIETSYKEMIDL